jgi:hypothetical protein
MLTSALIPSSSWAHLHSADDNYADVGFYALCGKAGIEVGNNHNEGRSYAWITDAYMDCDEDKVSGTMRARGLLYRNYFDPGTQQNIWVLHDQYDTTWGYHTAVAQAITERGCCDGSMFKIDAWHGGCVAGYCYWNGTLANCDPDDQLFWCTPTGTGPNWIWGFLDGD